MTITSTPRRPGKPAGPQPSPGAPGLPAAQGRQDGKPTRAERAEANRLAAAQAQLREIAAVEVPEPFRIPLHQLAAAPAAEASPLPGELAPQAEEQEKTGGPQPSPAAAGLPTAQERRHQAQEERKPIIGQSILPRGRPSEYTDEEADILCAWVQAGGSLRAYSRKTGRKPETVYRWMRENAGFQARYAQAHEDRADTLTDEMLEIADEAGQRPTIEGVAAAKLRVEARKWIASKLRPQKWGDKQTVEHVGAVNIRIGIPAKPGPTALPMADVVDAIPSQPAPRLT